MFEVLVTAAVGLALSLSLTVPPGPVNAIIASHAVTRSWRSGFFVGAGAMTADTVFLTISVLARSAIQGVHAAFPYIALLGAAVMGYFAWKAVRAWRSIPAAGSGTKEVHASSYVTGLTVNLSSPYALLWWLTAGVALIDQLGPVVLVGFFAGILLWIASFPYVLRAAQARYARTYHVALAFSILCLVAFAGLLLWDGITGLL